MSEEGGQKFWGEGSDLKLALYGMLNKVKSDYRPVDKTIWGPTDGNLKLKYGADLQYHATPSITAALRADRRAAEQDIPEQSFSIISPRIVFTSNWVTREQLTFQYSRYLYNQRECPANAVHPPASHACATPARRCASSPRRRHPAGRLRHQLRNPVVQPRSAPTMRPDCNVFKIEATFWW